MSRAIEVTGELQLTVDDRTIDVTADGSQVRAEIGDVASGRPSLRFALSGLTLARRLSRALDASHVTLVVTRHGRPVVELGAGVRGGTLARLLGAERVRVIRAPRSS